MIEVRYLHSAKSTADSLSAALARMIEHRDRYPRGFDYAKQDAERLLGALAATLGKVVSDPPEVRQVDQWIAQRDGPVVTTYTGGGNLLRLREIAHQEDADRLRAADARSGA